MSSTTDSLSSNLRNSLNHLGEGLYWSEEEYQAAAETIRNQAESYGFEHIETGQNRLILKIPPSQLDSYDEPLVVKLPRQYGSPDGLKQNVEEIDLWEHAPDWFREFLTPVEAAHPQGYWLVMRYAPEIQGRDEIEERLRDLHSHNIRSNELHTQNWGRWRGEAYLIDYGLDIAHQFPDIQVRNWEDIYDEDYTTRHPGESNEEVDEQTESADRDDSDEQNTPADLVFVTADARPDLKSSVRSELRGILVRTGASIEIELDEKTVLAEIEETEPRSDRSSRERWLQIDEETRILL